jgi:putative ABC transport system permease protein
LNNNRQTATVNLAGKEISRAKLRFGLLTGAVSLLVFLVLLLSTLSNALVSSLIGALEGLNADGLVYADTARDNIAASRLPPDTVSAVQAVPGVSRAAAVGTFTTQAVLPEGDTDMQIFGFQPEAPGAPTGLTSGNLPSAPGEAAVDGGSLAIGDTFTTTPGGTELTVVGLLRGAQFNAIPTAYVDLATYDELVTTANPGLPFVPINAVAFDTDSDTAAVAQAITDQVPGAVGYTRQSAVDLIPGIESITQSFGILVGLTFIIGIVVIGFFFLILTVQKLRSFTLLRAVGASSGSLARSVALQIVLVVLAASVIAVLLTFLAVRGLNTGIPVQLNPSLVIGTVAAVLLFSLLAGALSIRRITKIDPATAVGAR